MISRGSGRHADGSSGGRAWLLLRLDDGSTAYADLYNAEAGGAPGQTVTVKQWGGAVAEVEASGVATATWKNPILRSEQSWWANVVAGFFLLLSGMCTLFTLLGIWRTSQLRWATPITSA